MNRRFVFWLVGIGGTFALVGFSASHTITEFIQHLYQNPNASYVSAILQKHALKNPAHTLEWYGSYIPAVITRIACLVYLCVGFILYLVMTESGRGYWDKFWNHSSTAFNLGIFRLFAVWNVMTYDSGSQTSWSILNLSFDGMNVPYGYGVFHALLPPSESTLSTLMHVYPVLGWLAFLGVFTRFTLPLYTLVSFFVLLFPQFVGKMNHYHHIWLTLVFLSFSPCADALSVDSLIRRFRGLKIDIHAPFSKYGRPLVYVWGVLGAAYFFPGFWKFVASGWDWAFSDNIQLKILTKVWELGTEPAIPLYEYPLLCKLGGLGTLILEIGFPFAMIFPIPRILFGLGGIFFHEVNALTIQIGFRNIEWLYSSFVNWSRLLRRPSAWKAPVLNVFPKMSTAVCFVMVAGMYFTGFTAIETWPWANYPTFAPVEQRFVNSVEMRITLQSGEVQKVLLQEDVWLAQAYNNRTRLRSYLTLIMLEADSEKRIAMLRSLCDLWKKDKASVDVKSVEFWQVQIPLLPRGAPYVPYKVIGTF